MPPRTTLFQQLPWNQGLNTSLDESLIQPGQLTRADNIIFSTRASRTKRDGIDFGWDTGTTGTDSLIKLHDFWYGSSSKTQKMVGVNSAKAVYGYTSGTQAALTDAGTAWSGTLTTATMTTFNNQCFIAVDGSSNVIKRWNGSGNLLDVFSDYNLVSISRAVASNVVTLIFTAGFPGANGSTVVVSGAGVAAMNGTFTVTAVTTTSVTNDTITYACTTANTGTVADTGITVGSLAPKASIISTHIGRLVTNDKSNVDRIHYSPAFDHTKWLGFGDSGAFDIGTGDGDPDGITAIFPSFKGDLFIAKRTKLYRLTGSTPEDIQIIKVSDGIGCISQNSVVAVGQDDVMWISEKGVHSLQAVQAYGDFTSIDVSVDIQKTFNDVFSRSRLKYSQGGYIPQINSVAFAVTEAHGTNRALTTTSVNNALYLYNILSKAWYRWPDVPCSSLCVSNDSDKKRLYLGSHKNRVAKTFNGTTYDISTANAHVAVTLWVETGQMFPYVRQALNGEVVHAQTEPNALIGFKEFILYYRPQAETSVNVSVRIDKQRIPTENKLVYQESTGGTPLGSGSFVLGSTPLGTSSVLGGYSRMIDGVGHSAKIIITESSLTGVLEIQGFGLRMEPLVYTDETAASA